MLETYDKTTAQLFVYVTYKSLQNQNNSNTLCPYYTRDTSSLCIVLYMILTLMCVQF